MENKNIIAALVKAQLEIDPPVKDKTGQFKNKYASLDSILNAVRQPLARNGVVISRSVEKVEGELYLVIHLLHTSGESLQGKYPILQEKAGPQGMGSARTYAARYGISDILSLACDEDDDGKIAQQLAEKKTDRNFKDIIKDEPKLEAKEVAELEALVGADHELGDRILQGYQMRYQKEFSSFYDLPKTDLKAIKTRILSYKDPQPIKRILSYENPQPLQRSV